VQMNLNAVDKTLAHLSQIKIPDSVPESIAEEKVEVNRSPIFVREVLGKMIAGHGDQLPVSAFPADGTFPTGTSRLEKRNLAQEVPVWEPDICIQCGKCVLVCPHAVIRSKVYQPSLLETAPPSFKTREARLPEWKGMNYTLQVAVEDCTGCAILRGRLPGATQV
jgi:pyruvate-ferredoxin/flavodoxin oxidoreductase